MILCLVLCDQIQARYEETELGVCPGLGMHHRRSAQSEDGSRIVFCWNSTDGTVRGVTHIGYEQVSLVHVHV